MNILVCAVYIKHLDYLKNIPGNCPDRKVRADVSDATQPPAFAARGYQSFRGEIGLSCHWRNPACRLLKVIDCSLAEQIKSRKSEKKHRWVSCMRDGVELKQTRLFVRGKYIT